MIVPKLRFKGFDQDWTGLKIKDLVKSLDAGVSVNSEDVEPKEDEYSVLKTSCISSGYFDENERKRVLQDGEIQRLKEPVLDDSILMSRMNTPLLVGMNAYVFKAPKNTFLPDRLWQLKIDDNKTVTRWLAFYLGSDQGLNQIRDLASGTSNSMKNITKPDVLNLDLFVPSKEEQTKIASFLSNVDEKISQLTQKHALLSQYKQGMMQKLFSQQLRFKADDGSEFGEWEITSIKDAVSFIKDGTHGTHQDDPSSNLFLLSAKNLQNGKIVIDDKDRKINQKEFDSIYKNYKLQDGDILLSVVGTIGRVAIFKDYYESYAFQRSVAFMRFKKALTEFIYQLFLAKDFQNELLVRQVVSAQPGIYLGDLSKIDIKLPCLEEQTKIANFLSAIDQKIEVVAQQIQQAKTWKKGLLQQMFV